METYKFKALVLREHKPRSRERPKGRSGHRIVSDDRYMYSFGGFNPCITDDDPEMRNDETWLLSRPLFRELWKFNYLTERWKRLPSNKEMPNEVASNAVLLKDRTLVVYGGTGVPFGASCNNTLYACDSTSGDVRALPSAGDCPHPRYGQGMISHGPYVYTVGGTTGWEYSCDVHRYDLRKDLWETVYASSGDSDEPRGRYRHELAFDGTLVYVLGGGTADEAFDFQEIPVFDLSLAKWSVLEARKDPVLDAVPAPRRCHGLVQYTDERTGGVWAVISGGYSSAREFADVWRLELRTLRWTCLTGCRLPSPVYFHSVALTPFGKMYIFGGIVAGRNGITRTDAIHSTWLVVPKLQEMCWEALNFYVKDLAGEPRTRLASLGVPQKFIRRLDSC